MAVPHEVLGVLRCCTMGREHETIDRVDHNLSNHRSSTIASISDVVILQLSLAFHECSYKSDRGTTRSTTGDFLIGLPEITIDPIYLCPTRPHDIYTTLRWMRSDLIREQSRGRRDLLGTERDWSQVIEGRIGKCSKHDDLYTTVCWADVASQPAWKLAVISTSWLRHMSIPILSCSIVWNDRRRRIRICIAGIHGIEWVGDGVGNRRNSSGNGGDSDSNRGSGRGDRNDSSRKRWKSGSCRRGVAKVQWKRSRKRSNFRRCKCVARHARSKRGMSTC